MTFRLADTSFIQDKVVVTDYQGFGAKGDSVPSQSLMYEDVSLPSESSVEFRFQIITQPQYGQLTTFENGLFFYSGSGQDDSFVYRLFRDNVADSQDYTVTLSGSGAVYDEALAFGCLSQDNWGNTFEARENLNFNLRSHQEVVSNEIANVALSLVSSSAQGQGIGTIFGESLTFTTNTIDSFNGGSSLNESLNMVVGSSDGLSVNVDYDVSLTLTSNAAEGFSENAVLQGVVTLTAQQEDSLASQVVYDVSVEFNSEASQESNSGSTHSESLTLSSALSESISAAESTLGRAPSIRTVYIGSENRTVTINTRKRF